MGSIIDWWDRRAGYRAASREISARLESEVAREEIEAFRKRSFRGRRALFQGPFSQGWQRCWEERGWHDASAGRLEPSLLDQPAYRLGVQSKLESQDRRGWNNPAIEQQLAADTKD